VLPKPPDGPVLPPDNHVHSEWSWDTVAGSMERTCAVAMRLGLPAIAFTEHTDFTTWSVGPGTAHTLPPRQQAMIGPDGRVRRPRLDIDGYFACLDRCRTRYPDLRILSGVELGEAHWCAEPVRDLLASGRFERVLGSLHSLRVAGEYRLIDNLRPRPPADAILREYLAELLRMVDGSDAFMVLAHIDYPVRRWSPEAGPYHPKMFEEEYRAVLRALAGSGRVLEVNTRVPLHPAVVGWWYEVGGTAVSFGSDAHVPAAVGNGFRGAAAMVEAQGFRPGRHPYDFWVRG
jgi:histidinol-phosphatase (PHP family)